MKPYSLSQLKIVVLCGGLSTERNISFLTGSRVCGALRARGHRAVLADLYIGFDEMEDARGFDPEALAVQVTDQVLEQEKTVKILSLWTHYEF